MATHSVSKLVRLVRAVHVVTLHERDTAGAIQSVLQCVPAYARIVEMMFQPDDTGLRIEFSVETEVYE